MRNPLPANPITSNPPTENPSLGSDGLTEGQRDFARVVGRALAQKWRQLQSHRRDDIERLLNQVVSPSHLTDGGP